MCTLIAFHRVWDDWPLALAVNRDEAYDRSSSPPEWIEGNPRILAPRDDQAGGTWMGANERGLWVGVTNRHKGDVDPGRRSRGLLCLDLLSSGSADEVADRIGALEEPYNPFHLVAGDGADLRYVEYEVAAVEARRLGEGCHLVTNRPFGEMSEEPKVERAWALLGEAGLWPAAPGGNAPVDLVSRLAGILADHGRRGFDALCLHGGRYGTRSAAVWRLRPSAGEGAAEIRLAFTDGPPCSAAFARVG